MFLAPALAGLVNFGGVDRHLAAELESASRMTGVLGPLARLLSYAARLGAALSQRRDRSPVTLHDATMTEARDLELRRSEVDASI
jgi:hypothetical protein